LADELVEAGDDFDGEQPDLVARVVEARRSEHEEEVLMAELTLVVPELLEHVEHDFEFGKHDSKVCVLYRTVGAAYREERRARGTWGPEPTCQGNSGSTMSRDWYQYANLGSWMSVDAEQCVETDISCSVVELFDLEDEDGRELFENFVDDGR
jgi:hypothetical protein